MPERQTTKRAHAKLRHGDRPSTAAGEFVREEMDHIREGKHGARSAKQAIAIGLSKARRAGIRLKPSPNASARARSTANRELAEASGARAKPRRSARRARASLRALKREPRAAASHRALAAHARTTARARGPAARKASARKAARTRAEPR